MRSDSSDSSLSVPTSWWAASRSLQAVTLALEYGLFDVDRLERLILRVIARNYLRLADQEEE